MDDFVWLIGLLVMAVLALPVAGLLVALGAHSRLKRLQGDLLNLERQVAVLRRARRPQVEPRPAPRPMTPSPVPAPAPVPEDSPPRDAAPDPDPVAPAPEPEPTTPPAPPSPPDAPEVPEPEEPRIQRPKSAEHLGAWVFAAAGGLGLLVGGLLFFSYALDQGWLAFFGPGARFATGLAAGVAALVGSERLVRRRFSVPAAALGGAGIGILYGALYAGHSLYELFPNLAAFGLMAGVTAVSVLLAWRRDSQFLAILGLIGGLMTPVLLSTGDNKALALFAYLAVVNAGVLGTAVLRKWPVTVGLAGLGTLLLQLGWGFEYGDADQLPYGLGAAAIFAAMAAAVVLHPRSSDAVRKVASGTLVAQALAILPLTVPHDLVVWEGVRVEAVLQDPGAVVWLLPVFLFGLAALLRVVAVRRDWPVLAMVGLGVLALPLLVLGFGWESELEALDRPHHPLHVLVTAALLAPALGWWLAGLGRPWVAGLREWITPALLVVTGLIVGASPKLNRP